MWSRWPHLDLDPHLYMFSGFDPEFQRL
jgi:hypothetical protein